MRSIERRRSISVRQFIMVSLAFLAGMAVHPFGGMTYANERRFTYIYESPVLSPGARELEIWNTYRSGKPYYYHRLDQRIELEFGVVDRLMTSLYLNYEWKMFDTNGDAPGGEKGSEQGASVSTEWKYKIFDRVADPLGLALYGEFTLGLDERELEMKIILDKQTGRFLLTGNLIAEQEWKNDVVNGVIEAGKEVKLGISGGISYSVTSQFSFGVEAVQQNILVGGAVEHAALFAGPVISYATEEWWATLTVLPQVVGLKGETVDGLDLDEFERSQARLLISFHL